MRYELYPDGCKDLRAHVVVTSFDTPTPSNGDPAFFRRIKWTGMIVDEGQRLKNDESELYGVLNSLKVGFKMILTGRLSKKAYFDKAYPHRYTAAKQQA